MVFSAGVGYTEEELLRFLVHLLGLWKEHFRLDQLVKISESEIVECADEGNSSKEMKKSSLEFGSRTRTFAAASAVVCIGSSLDLQIFPSRMFGEVSEEELCFFAAAYERNLVLSQQREFC